MVSYLSTLILPAAKESGDRDLPFDLLCSLKISGKHSALQWVYVDRTAKLLSETIRVFTYPKADRSLAEYARSEGLSFTRYVDDLTFSGEVTDRHSADIGRILDDAGWSVNTRKTAFMRRGGRQYVTGLYVGEPDRPRIPRKIKRPDAMDLAHDFRIRLRHLYARVRR